MFLFELHIPYYHLDNCISVHVPLYISLTSYLWHAKFTKKFTFDKLGLTTVNYSLQTANYS